MVQRRAVGPLDKRRKVTRCLACAKRRIKCEGGFPCAHCIRKTMACVPQQQTGHGMIMFVHRNQQNDPRTDHRNSDRRSMAIANKNDTGLCLESAIGKDQDTHFLDCFVSFIQQNTFTMSFVSILPDLLPLTSTSPVLYHAVMAIGALDANRHGSGLRALSGEKPARVAAISSYQTSMVALQSCLGEQNVMQRDDVLWATFFLGLFELLSDNSGEGWVKHMLYGTSKMLQLAGPSDCMSSLRKAFYDLFRVLEASRALLYGEETILSQECWLQLQKNLCSSITTGWQPMEEILTLMIQSSAFSLRARDIIRAIPESERYTNPSMALLAAEGLSLQKSIYAWHTEALLQLSSQDNPNGYLDLALLYYHALIIFLSGNYDYFSYWNRIPAPVLSPAEVSDHLVAILELSQQVLFQTSIPGVMLAFPLTVAGARARHADQRSKILDLLDWVSWRGFVVANRVRKGCLECWAERDREGKRPKELSSRGVIVST